MQLERLCSISFEGAVAKRKCSIANLVNACYFRAPNLNPKLCYILAKCCTLKTAAFYISVLNAPTPPKTKNAGYRYGQKANNAMIL
jgi:hypothetical protein